MTDQPCLEVPFDEVEKWEKIEGSCARLYAAAEWGYKKGLAIPPPEPPTDEEIAAWVDTPFDNVPDEMPSEEELKEYRCFTEKGLGRTIRAALEMWGR